MLNYTDGSTKYSKSKEDLLFKPYNIQNEIYYKGGKTVIKLSENTSKSFPFSSLAGQYYNSNYRFVFSYKGWSEQYGAIDKISRTASQSYTETVSTNITVVYDRTNNLVTVTNNSSYYVVLEIELLAVSS